MFNFSNKFCYKNCEKVYYNKNRFLILFFMIFVVFIFLIFRLTYIQLIQSRFLNKESDLRSLRIEKSSSFRGMIMDRHGKLIAVSVPTYGIWMNPKIVGKNINLFYDKKWKILSNELHIPLKEILNKIIFNYNNSFVYLARKVDLNIVNYIKKLHINGIFFLKEERRYYPYGPIFAHLIGFTNIDNIGIEGIEKSFDNFLKGQKITRLVRKDKNGKIVDKIFPFKEKISKNLILSVDEYIQSIVYYELKKGVKRNKAKFGIGVVLDIHTGEILAMAGWPSYNPNSFNKLQLKYSKNRSITDLFEPGSTVKPMIVIAALKNKIITPDTVFNTDPYILNGHKIRDVTYYKKLSVTEILKKSSNVGISKIALSLSEMEIIDVYNKFGFGKKTNLGLIGENNNTTFMKKKHWSAFEKAVFSFGYGLMVTPLQLARVYATLGSFGIYRPLSIVKINHPVSGLRIYSKNIVKNVIYMLEQASLDGGSASKVDIKNYRVAIKTGTVKKIDNNGRYINRYIAYAAGIAPVSNPKYALVVVINEPSLKNYYGGIVSAPIFGVIMNNILRFKNIVPDKTTLKINTILNR